MVDGKTVGQIKRGYILFLGVMRGDTKEEAEWLTEKICKLRLFDGEDGKINDCSIKDIGGEILIVSQFTLAGDFKKGSRPDYTAAMEPQLAEIMYDTFIKMMKQKVSKVESGVFGAKMEVSLINNGPVTLMLEKKTQ